MSKQDRDNENRFLSSLTPTESVVRVIWEEVLQQDNIGPEDNFFEQGGDSIMTMMVLFQVSDTLGVELPPGALFEAQTLREFCRLIECTGGETGSHTSLLPEKFDQ